MKFKKRIAILGHGFVGRAVDYAFTNPNIEKLIVDLKYGNSIEDIPKWNPDLVFICLPTPSREDGSVNYDPIVDSIKYLCTWNDTSVIGHSDWMVVIKSTVPPVIFDELEDHTHRIVYNPEFLTENNALNDFINMKFNIIGHEGYASDGGTLKWYYDFLSLCNPHKTIFTGLKEASLIKYAANAFLATKVTFFNELYDYAEATDIDFQSVVNALGQDERIGFSHTRVPGPDGKRGFGGSCFPKDTRAMVHFAGENTVSVINSSIKKNNSYRSKYELSPREKEQNIKFNS